MRSRSQCAGVSLLVTFLLLIPTVVQAQVCFPVPEGLVSWWPGDGNSTDIESGNNGALVGGTAFSLGRVDQAFDFDGVDDYVLVPHNANLDPGTGSFTLTAWVKTASTGNQTLVSKYECGGSCPSGVASSLYFLSMSMGKVVAEIRDSDASSPGELFLTGSSNIADGNFHHVAMLRDVATSQLRVYVDGAQDASAALNAGSDSAIQDDDGEADPLLIGGFFNGGTTTLRDPFTGLIDELEYFNRALSGPEIQAIFDAGTAGFCKDEDGDGFRPPDDCDEGDPFVNPDAIELPGNFVDENCDGSLGDVDPCADWQNHGKYVRAVAHAVNDLVDAGLITEEEGDVLVSSAAMAKIGKTGFVPPECME